jgi:hypothetical protein
LEWWWMFSIPQQLWTSHLNSSCLMVAFGVIIGANMFAGHNVSEFYIYPFGSYCLSL